VWVVSYEVLRHDLAVFLERGPFLYCVLDEGHVIKNPDAKLTRAVKALRAEHRLILSGTPIQVLCCAGGTHTCVATRQA
jgi:TATA-binding protein-associated factor